MYTREPDFISPSSIVFRLVPFLGGRSSSSEFLCLVQPVADTIFSTRIVRSTTGKAEGGPVHERGL